MLKVILLTAFVINLLLGIQTTQVGEYRRGEYCTTTRESQVISLKGCENKTIENYICRGQCMSGYVPENGMVGDFLCRSCQPSNIKIETISLQCIEGLREYTVEIFGKCECIKNPCFPMNSIPEEKLSIIPPCRDKCRRCRRAKRKYQELVLKRDHNDYLNLTCSTKECLKRINTHISKKTLSKGLLMKEACTKCKSCKRNKKPNFDNDLIKKTKNVKSQKKINIPKWMF